MPKQVRNDAIFFLPLGVCTDRKKKLKALSSSAWCNAPRNKFISLLSALKRASSLDWISGFQPDKWKTFRSALRYAIDVGAFSAMLRCRNNPEYISGRHGTIYFSLQSVFKRSGICIQKTFSFAALLVVLQELIIPWKRIFWSSGRALPDWLMQ